MDSSMTMDGMDQVSGASIDPANTMCQDTDAPFYNLQLSSNSQWHMINLVNAGAAQMLSFSIDGHDLWIVSADGAFVKPQKIQILPIGIGQRYGIMLKRPDSSAPTQYTIRASTMTHQTYQGNAVLTYVTSNSSTSSGSASSLPNSKPSMTIDGSPIDSSAKMLEDAALAPYPIYAVPNATRELRLMVNQSAPTVWVLEMGHAFKSNNGQQTPLLFAPRNASGVFSLERGEVVDVLLQISKDSLDTMAHPIHLHGHYFRVLGSSPNSTFPEDKTVAQMAQMGSSEYKINTRSDAPRRDSAHLPEAGWLAIRFASSNPGVWLLHCHINSHLSSGMAVAFIELAGELQQFPRNVTSPPSIAPYDPIPSLAK